MYREQQHVRGYLGIEILYSGKAGVAFGKASLERFAVRHTAELDDEVAAAGQRKEQ